MKRGYNKGFTVALLLLLWFLPTMLLMAAGRPLWEAMLGGVYAVVIAMGFTFGLTN